MWVVCLSAAGLGGGLEEEPLEQAAHLPTTRTQVQISGKSRHAGTLTTPNHSTNR
jgi:hypothetical protein